MATLWKSGGHRQATLSLASPRKLYGMGGICPKRAPSHEDHAAGHFSACRILSSRNKFALLDQVKLHRRSIRRLESKASPTSRACRTLLYPEPILTANLCSARHQSKPIASTENLLDKQRFLESLSRRISTPWSTVTCVAHRPNPHQNASVRGSASRTM